GGGLAAAGGCVDNGAVDATPTSPMKTRFLPPCLFLAATALCNLAQAAEYTWTDAAGAHAVTLARTESGDDV
ncbi:hypothetical protein NO135_25945, partial [Clostridioides difficile]|nr:hypothetical protein [Clostridioides difficile]